MADRVRVGVLISGRGSNLVALSEYKRRDPDRAYDIALVASNVPEARGLVAARRFGIKTWAESHKGVPRADMYRVTVWDRSGTVVWDGETRDTVLPLPPALTRVDRGAWLWVVDARTGWDRWVSSELHEFTIR